MLTCSVKWVAVQFDSGYNQYPSAQNFQDGWLYDPNVFDAKMRNQSFRLSDSPVSIRFTDLTKFHEFPENSVSSDRALPSIPLCSDDASSEVFSKTALFSLYGGDPTTHHWCSDVPPLLLLLPQMPPRLKLPNLSATTEGKLHLLICEAIRSIRLKKMIPLKVYYYDGGFFKCLKLLSFVSSIVFRLSSPFSDERF